MLSLKLIHITKKGPSYILMHNCMIDKLGKIRHIMMINP